MTTIKKTITCAINTLFSHELAITYGLRNHPDVAFLRTMFSTVVVIDLKITILCVESDSDFFVMGLIPSTRAADSSVKELLNVPHQSIVGAYDNDRRVHIHTGLAPGLEYDLAQTSIRGGHPTVRVGHINTPTPVPADPKQYVGICNVVLEFSVECSGQAFGG